ncbi:MAG: hypothetical protein HOW73_35230 [Polyangiaceae bacterium]|nr:hypothetical protein [Polyangiaceae bacterium]
MTMTDREALAGLRVLVAVAKADGVVKNEEKEAIGAALEGRSETVESILETAFDLDKELAAITNQQAREQTYRSAYALANADGECSDEERRLLEKIRNGLSLDAKQSSIMDRVLKETKETVMASAIKKVDDPAKRSKEIREDTWKYSVLSAVLGAFPVPGLAIATDLAVVALQGKLVRDIGQYYGHTMDKQAVTTLLAGLGVGTAARIAVTNLIKFVPGWGSAVGGASSFASTFALGKIIEKYFERGGKDDIATLKSEFKAAEKEGKKEFEANKAEIAAKKDATKAELDKLNTSLEKGEISQADYEKRAAALA